MNTFVIKRIERIRRGDLANQVFDDIQSAAVIAARERQAVDAIAVAIKAGIQAGANLRPLFEGLPGGLEAEDNRITFEDTMHDLANVFAHDFAEKLLLAETPGGEG